MMVHVARLGVKNVCERVSRADRTYEHGAEDSVPNKHKCVVRLSRGAKKRWGSNQLRVSEHSGKG